MRYVADAPLRSLRSDLGLPTSGQAMPFASGKASASTAVLNRVTSVEAAITRIEGLLHKHTTSITAMTTEAVQTSSPTYVQNTVTGTVQRARPIDDGRTLCGLSFRGSTHRARRRDGSTSYCMLESISEIPGQMLCDRRLPSERAAAMDKDIIHDKLSGDEV